MIRNKVFLFPLLTLGFVLTHGTPASATVKLHSLFTSNMVLQRDMKVPVWGTADDGEKVTVRFQNQEVSATAAGGKWEVRLDNLKVGGPFELTVSGTNTVQLANVLVGEVWIASGQSNMQWPVSASDQAREVIAQSKNPMIRLFTVPMLSAAEPKHDLPPTPGMHWQECGPNTVGNFSAVAYFFGKHLQESLNVPIGLINTSWGGTAAEAWTRRGILEADPELKGMVDAQIQAAKAYPAAVEKHKKDLAKFKESKKTGKGPQPPYDPILGFSAASSLYNAMISPLIPYAIRGAIWYQGESNAGRAYQYRTLMPTLIKNWREDWKEPDLTFLQVQLAPFLKKEAKPQESAWAELREAQLLTTVNLPKSGMAVITDVGHETDIHPKWKEPVGARLALAARALAYGEKIEYSGPAFDKLTVEGNKAILSFTHVGKGLTAKDGALKGFAICGKDHKFVNAEATIDGDKVIVTSPQVSEPVAVRYGWANYPDVNLWNNDGLPASPFRTDDFQMVTGPKK